MIHKTVDENLLTGRLETGTSNKEPIDIGLLGKLLAVLLADATTVQDTCGLGDLRRNGAGEELADGSVNFLCLFRGGDLSGANGPGSWL
jgi:hypothetical protein